MKIKRFLSSPTAKLLTAAGCLAAGSLGVYLYASRVEARRYRLEKMRLTAGNGIYLLTDSSRSRKKEPELKVLHLSDLHLSRPESHKIEFLQRITDDEYDLVVLTGDVFENYSGVEYASSILSRKPRLGAFAVLGNHDYYDYTWFNKTIGRINRKFRHPPSKRDVTPMIDALEAGGFTVMRNNAITFPQDKLHLIGVDYPGIKPQELSRLAKEAPPDALVMCILHVPRKLHDLPDHGVHVAFCGHTHGGQIRIPGFGPLITDSELPRHEASGLLWRKHTAIHVSRGVGADPKTNFRLFCPPHATVVHVSHHVS